MSLIDPPSKTESMVPISFRGTSKHRAIIKRLSHRLGCTESGAVRIVLELADILTAISYLALVFHRVYVNDVLRKPESVIHNPQE